MKLTDLFLKAKHWQIFLMLFVLPMLVMFALMGWMIATTIKNPVNDMYFFDRYFSIFPFVMVGVMSLLYMWQWSLAVGLRKTIPEDIRPGNVLFKFAFFIPLIYFLFFAFTFSNIMFLQENPLIILLIFPMHLISMAGMFYCLFHIAKVVKTAELQRKVSITEYAGEFFMMWFYPVGLWFIQPKVNKAIDNYLNPKPTNTDKSHYETTINY